MNGRGFASLGTVLLTLVVAFLALLTVASTSIFSLQFSRRVHLSRSAERMASSAIHQAVARFIQQPGFASDLRVDGPEGWGRITFQPGNPEGLPHSTNNWEGNHPRGYQRGVPQGMVHLVATGNCRGVVRHCEALIDMPVFPMAIACSGPITLDAATVASIKDDMLGWPLSDILAAQLDPGNLASDNPRSPDSVLLKASSHVTGFVQSKGGIQNLGAAVDGELRPMWPEQLELPDMSATMLDPRRPAPEEENVLYTTLQGQNGANPAHQYSDLVVSSHSVINGTLQVNGRLTINDGILFVDGDLIVRGGVDGQGAIGVRGSASIEGDAQLRASSRVAILADGDLSLKGVRKDAQRYEGILYSKGRITIEKVTLLGACIQNAPAGSPANEFGVTVHDANVIWARATNAMAFDPPVDLLIPSVFPEIPVVDEVPLSQGSQDGDVIRGTTRVRGNVPRGPGELKRLANNWNPNDVGVIRITFNSQGEPRIGYFWWGRSTEDNSPLRNPDGSPAIGGVYYPSLEALLTGRNQGTAGPEGAVMALLANPDHPPTPGGIDNLPNVIVHGLGHSGGYREYGNGGAEGVQADSVRQRLQVTVGTALAKVIERRRRDPRGRSYFSLDPSRFLNRARSVKIRFWRSL